MLRFGKTKLAKEIFYGTKKQLKKWDVEVDTLLCLVVGGVK